MRLRIAPNGIETIRAANVYLAVEGSNGMHLSRETILGQEITIYRRHLDGKDAMSRGSPKHAVPVVHHIRHLVGAEPVCLGDGIEVVVVPVGNNQSLVLLHLHFQSVVQVLHLGDVFQDGYFFARHQRIQRHDFRLHARTEVGIGALFQPYAVPSHLVDVIVAGHEVQCPASRLVPAVVLKYFHHLALELSLRGYLPKKQFAVGPVLQPGKEVVASHPDGVLAVPIDHRDAADVGRVDDAPLGTVIVQQALEVGNEHRTVLAGFNVVVSVVAAIFRCRVVANQRDTLRA